jgi:heme-degrading monooxygenase HmoA
MVGGSTGQARDMGHAVATTPEPPYIAVIFTSVRSAQNEGYDAMARRMEELAATQPGYLGVEAARENLGITVSYWATEADALAWKLVGEHLHAQMRGRSEWYESYRVRIARVERAYGFDRDDH